MSISEKLYFYLVGDRRKLSLESKIFNVTVLATIVALSLNGIYNYSMGIGGLPIFIITMVIVAIDILLYYRSRRYFVEMYTVWILLFTIYLSLAWPMNAGSYGGVLAAWMLPFLYSVIFLRGKKRFFVLTFNIVFFIGLMYAEYILPEKIVMYPDKLTRYIDITWSILIVAFGITFITNVVIKNIDNERQKSEQLLLNILPASVATELKESGKVQAIHFQNVSMLFTDFQDFTKISQTMDANELVAELNEIYTQFDQIAKENNCERIKTIGDAYFAVSGLPVENENHARNITNCALQIVEYLKERNENSAIEWNIRVGIHTGDAIGAIVGITKFQYDVFGDTVNFTSRLEASSEAMKINVSETTYKHLKDEFKFTDRGQIEVKGKGAVKMYYLKEGQAKAS